MQTFSVKEHTGITDDDCGYLVVGRASAILAALRELPTTSCSAELAALAYNGFIRRQRVVATYDYPDYARRDGFTILKASRYGVWDYDNVTKPVLASDMSPIERWQAVIAPYTDTELALLLSKPLQSIPDIRAGKVRNIGAHAYTHLCKCRGVDPLALMDGVEHSLSRDARLVANDDVAEIVDDRADLWAAILLLQKQVDALAKPARSSPGF